MNNPKYTDGTKVKFNWGGRTRPGKITQIAEGDIFRSEYVNKEWEYLVKTNVTVDGIVVKESEIIEEIE